MKDSYADGVVKKIRLLQKQAEITAENVCIPYMWMKKFQATG